MTSNIGSLVVSALCLVVAVGALSHWGKKLAGRPAAFGAAYGIVQLISTVIAGAVAAGLGASQWAIVSALAITCGGLALWTLIPGLLVQVQLRRDRDAC